MCLIVAAKNYLPPLVDFLLLPLLAPELFAAPEELFDAPPPELLFDEEPPLDFLAEEDFAPALFEEPPDFDPLPPFPDVPETASLPATTAP